MHTHTVTTAAIPSSISFLYAVSIYCSYPVRWAEQVIPSLQLRELRMAEMNDVAADPTCSQRWAQTLPVSFSGGHGAHGGWCPCARRLPCYGGLSWECCALERGLPVLAKAYFELPWNDSAHFRMQPLYWHASSIFAEFYLATDL